MPRSEPASPGRVLLTRPGDKNLPLADALASLGIPSLSCPLIDIVPNDDKAPTGDLTGMLRTLSADDILIAVSDTAVRFARQRHQIAWPAHLHYYAVGRATARAMAAAGMPGVQLPDDPRTEGLLALPSLQHLSGRRVLILRGEGGRETLAETLAARGAEVSYCELYRRQPIQRDAGQLSRHWQEQRVTTIVVTSGEILLNLLTLLTASRETWWHRCRLVVPSPRVARLARDRGWREVIQARSADTGAIIESIKTLQSEAHG